MVSIRFQILFHSPRRGAFHLSLTVLVPYRCVRVFSLGGWSPRFHAACRVRGVTQAVCPPPSPSGTGLSPALVGLPRPFPFVRGDCCKPLLPRRPERRRFGLFGVRSPLLAELFSLPRATEMFQFTRFPHPCGCDPVSTGPGFPIRTSSASSPAHGSPTLFAVYHVLPRHGRARHPPYALLWLVACDTETLSLSRSFCCWDPLVKLRPEVFPRPPPASSPLTGAGWSTPPTKTARIPGCSLTACRYTCYTLFS